MAALLFGDALAERFENRIARACAQSFITAQRGHLLNRSERHINRWELIREEAREQWAKDRFQPFVEARPALHAFDAVGFQRMSALGQQPGERVTVEKLFVTPRRQESRDCGLE